MSNGGNSYDCNACERLDAIEEELVAIDGEITEINSDVLTIQNLLTTYLVRSYPSGAIPGAGFLSAGGLVQVPCPANYIIVPLQVILRKYCNGDEMTSSSVVTLSYIEPGDTEIYKSLDTNSDFWQGTDNTISVHSIDGQINTTTTVSSSLIGSNLELRLSTGITFQDDEYANLRIHIDVIYYLWGPYENDD